jgi:putative RecB family exonuclease
MDVLDRLSPSKISAFRHCPQHFAFRYIDGLEEPDDPWMVRGTLVHAVCERLFDLPPARRTITNAVALLHRLWECMVDADPALSALFTDAQEATAWLLSAERLLATWFRLEAPAEVDGSQRELFVECASGQGVLAGIIDRLDRCGDGTWAITDYKTGRAPSPGWEQAGFFQLRFYAMVVAQSLGLHVSRLRLVHLGGSGEVLELPFDTDGVEGVGRQVRGLHEAMRSSLQRGRWHANVGRQCDWCAFKPRCPAWSET